MASHDDKVKRIAYFLKNRKSTKPVRFIKKSISHQVPKPGCESTAECIDISDLNEIIEIDSKKKTCTAEPGVTFLDLVKETLRHGLIPRTVPELKTITIGGAVAGCSVESMSYKYGGFHDSCIEYEMIDAKGRIINCSKTKDFDIFNMLHGTFGTLGVITKLKFHLLPAKRYVYLTYQRYSTLKDYKKAIWKHFVKNDVDFMEGIIHSKDCFVLCLGNFWDSAPYTSSYEWMQVYYKSTLSRKEDYMKTEDYFFRYDSDCHWIARNYGLENPILRFLLGKFFLSSTRMLTFAKKLRFIFKGMKPDVVIDVFIPFTKADKFIKFHNTKLGHFPIWVVPYRIAKPYPWISEEYAKRIKDDLFIDFAIYGMKQKGNIDYYRLIETELPKMNGVKTLISYNSYTQSEFWKIWNRNSYMKIKKKVDPKNIFNDLYHKTHPKTHLVRR